MFRTSACSGSHMRTLISLCLIISTSALASDTCWVTQSEARIWCEKADECRHNMDKARTDGRTASADEWEQRWASASSQCEFYKKQEVTACAVRGDK